MLLTAVFTGAILLLCCAGLGIKMIFQKGGEFRGGCASNNPMLKNEIGECGVCGAKPDEQCKQEDMPAIQT